MSQRRPSPWPHRWAWLLACATFPLVWVGGLVTTTNSGMAFRDWLTSDGHFMLIYPWFQAAGEKFIEHGHRLLGALVGFLAIGLVLVFSRTELRRWVRCLSWALLAGVILQGVLGGMRVLLAVEHDNGARALALLHGCTGPLFFALCVAMVVFTSPAWFSSGTEFSVGTGFSTGRDAAGQQFAGSNVTGPNVFQLQKLVRVGLVTSGLAYGQLVLGAIVRHTPHMTGHLASIAFQTAIYFHLLVAGLLLFYLGLLLWRGQQAKIGLLGPLCLLGFFAVQIGLGACTWWVKYGQPAWTTPFIGEQNYLNRAVEILPAVIITSHVAIGSLIGVTVMSITLLAIRRLSKDRRYVKGERQYVKGQVKIEPSECQSLTSQTLHNFLLCWNQAGNQRLEVVL
ncbi:MAG: cytochrome oxidase assembly protein [Pirellulales bacterium]